MGERHHNDVDRARERNITFSSPESDISPVRSPRGGGGSGCGDGGGRAGLRGALPARRGGRSSRRLPGQLRPAALPRSFLPGEPNALFLRYFYTLHGRKRGSASHEHREIPGERNSSARHPQSSWPPEFAGGEGRSCGCTASLFLRET